MVQDIAEYPVQTTAENPMNPKKPNDSVRERLLEIDRDEALEQYRKRRAGEVRMKTL